MPIFPRVNRSMCGCSLETGTIIVGWLSVVTDIIVFVLFMDQYTKDHSENFFSLLVKEVIVIFRFIFDVLLIIGAHKKRPSFLLIWMISKCVFLSLFLSYIITSLVGKLEFLETIRASIDFAIGVYYIIIVNGYYEELKSNRAGAT